MARFSQIETDILRLIAEGHTDHEIAEILALSVYMVKSHVRVLLIKLEARNRTHAVYIAIGEGVLI